ncbi:MAG TPA: hypothetical protein VHY08_20715 [Bacillota bacterium]|nr:hypothetical protein [Bacillota bacterium]
MKMRVFYAITFLIVLFLTLSGCETSPITPISPTPTPAFYPTPPSYSDIYLRFNITPSPSRTDCLIFRDHCDSANTEFNNAVIKINNTQLTLSNNNHFSGSISYNDGDIINVSITHPALGVITRQLTVPNSLSEPLTTDPSDINQWVSGAVSNLRLSWSPTNANCYEYYVRRYDSNKNPNDGDGNISTSNFVDFDRSCLLYKFNLTGYSPYVKLSVTPRNETVLYGFFGYSCIDVAATQSKIFNRKKGGCS